jgi:lyso-ornithine lipid O-acyltransferase
LIVTEIPKETFILPCRLFVGMIRFISFISLMLIFLVHHALVQLIIRNEKIRFRYYMRSIRNTSRLGLKILNVRVVRSGVRGEVTRQLIVANHLSYLDILVLFRELPSLFITSTEIRDTFLLGHICKLAGCFFVERRREKRSLTTKNRELAGMKEKFEQGFNIFLFPEGTSSDGKGVLPFKATFFQLAVDTETSVIPVCIKYAEESDQVVPWYGDMTFPDHLFRLCLQKKIQVEVKVLDEVKGVEKMTLARICHEKISEAYA